MPCDGHRSQLLQGYWAKDQDTFIKLLDGNLQIPGDVTDSERRSVCLFKLSCRPLDKQSHFKQLIVRAPAALSPEQQLLVDAVHGMLYSNQGSAVMAAAPGSLGWLTLVRSDLTANLPGFSVLQYETGGCGMHARLRHLPNSSGCTLLYCTDGQQICLASTCDSARQVGVACRTLILTAHCHAVLC
jgi:hypothetical protein